MSADGTVEFVLQPASEDFDANDPRWQDQVVDLCESVEENVGGLRRDVAVVPGAKGGVETLILALGSAGAITAAVEAFRAWLARDRTRRLALTTTVDGQTETIELTGVGVNTDEMRRFMEAAMQRSRS